MSMSEYRHTYVFRVGISKTFFCFLCHGLMLMLIMGMAPHMDMKLLFSQMSNYFFKPLMKEGLIAIMAG